MYNPDNEQNVSISYKVAEHGWGDIALSQGEQIWKSDVSYVMDDSLGNLIRASIFLLGGGDSATFRIDAEGMMFELTATYNSIEVVDILHEEVGVVFSAKTPWYNFIEEVLKVATNVKKEVGIKGYQEKAGIPFPVDDLEFLSKRYKEYRDKYGEYYESLTKSNVSV